LLNDADVGNNNLVKVWNTFH